MTKQPYVDIVPQLLHPEDESPMEYVYSDADAALRGAASAEQLDLGWVLTGYNAPISEDAWRREYRLLVWRQLTSEIGPMTQ